MPYYRMYQQNHKRYVSEKKLHAFWYAPPEEQFPWIFISELRVADLSNKAQDSIHRYTALVQWTACTGEAGHPPQNAERQKHDYA